MGAGGVSGAGRQPDERSRLVAAGFVRDGAPEDEVGLAAGVAVAREGVRGRAIADAVEHQTGLPLPDQLAQLDSLAEVAPLDRVEGGVVDLDPQEVAQIPAELQSFTS